MRGWEQVALQIDEKNTRLHTLPERRFCRRVCSPTCAWFVAISGAAMPWPIGELGKVKLLRALSHMQPTRTSAARTSSMLMRSIGCSRVQSRGATVCAIIFSCS